MDEITWGGVPLCATYGALITDVTMGTPSVKSKVVSIPGGVDIDLTDALTGHAAFENRPIEIELVVPPGNDAQGLINATHGISADFQLSWDDGYTYSGLASVGDVETVGQGYKRFTLSIDASPWKVKQVHTETISAVGGVMMTCESGRRPVHPLITCDYPVTVNWNGQQFVVPSGQTYRMTAVTFTQGENKIWLSIYAWKTATWADLASETWADLAGVEWAKVVVSDGEQQASDFPGNGSVTLQWSEEYI